MSHDTATASIKPVPTDAQAGLTAAVNSGSYAVELDYSLFKLQADHGVDSTPEPFDLLLGSLASCVLMTVEMYASRKQWPLERAELRVRQNRAQSAPLEAVRLELKLVGDDLSDEQRTRILEIAGRCPVHRTLSAGVRIDTVLAD